MHISLFSLTYMIRSAPSATMTAYSASIITLSAYLWTLAPTIFVRDSSELAAAASSLGLVHSPGYPVYLLIAHLFTYLPVDDSAYSVNLLSAISTGMTVALVVILLDKLAVSRLSAFTAALALAFSFYIWSLSVIAEVYTLQIYFLAIILYMLRQWQHLQSTYALRIAAFVTGLAAVNNPATILWWPGFIALAFASQQKWSKHQIGQALICFGLGITPIVYLPLRAMAEPAFSYAGYYDLQAQFHQFDLTQPRLLLWYILGGPFRGLAFAYSAAELITESISFFYRLWSAFYGIGIPLGLWGIWKLWQREPVFSTGLCLIMVCHALFFIAYRAPDKDTMFLPVYLIWSLFLGVGLDNLLKIIPRWLHLSTLLLPLGLFLLNISFIDINHFYEIRELAEARLEIAEPDALFLARWGDASAMEYLQVAEGMRPDVTVINIFLGKKWRTLVENRLKDSRPVYSTFKDRQLESRVKFIPIQEYGYQYYLKGGESNVTTK